MSVRLPMVAQRWLAVIVVAVLALLVTVRPPYGVRPDIRSDGLGYHAWTPALLRADLDFCGNAGLISTKSTPAEPNAAGHCPNKYPPGLALLQFPVMAPLSLANDRSLDPSHAEDLASRWLATFALVGMSAALVATCRRLRIAPRATHVAVLSLVFGTGLFHYGTFDNSFVHIYIAFLIALLTYLGVRAAVDGRAPNPFVVGALVFLIIDIREVSVIAIVGLAMLWAGHLRARAPDVRLPDRTLVAAGAGLVAAVGVEMAYASWARGAFALANYGDEQADPRRLHELQVLFDLDHGLLTWYPIVLVVAVLVVACRAIRAPALVWLGGMAASLLLYGSWEHWNLGGGFGQRGFLDLMPGAAVLFAVALQESGDHARTIALACIPASVAVTLELMAGYWDGSIPYQLTTTRQYLAHVNVSALVLVTVVLGVGAITLRGQSPAVDGRLQRSS